MESKKISQGKEKYQHPIQLLFTPWFALKHSMCVLAMHPSRRGIVKQQIRLEIDVFRGGDSLSDLCISLRKDEITTLFYLTPLWMKSEQIPQHILN